jgi:predicted DNA-binding transcriptional regulator YafY
VLAGICRIVELVRASRLMALMMRLQDRGHATAAQLASELEVSVRTIYRDVAALQAAGVPLWTDTGPGGGIRLLEGWRTRLDGLTGDEAGALFMSGARDAAAELGLGAVLAAAEAKVLTTLPPELRSRAGRMRERFHLDAPGWFHRRESTEHLGAVADAVWTSRRVELTYRRSPTAEPVARRLDPLGLVAKSGTWYLVARVAVADEPVRTYRVGRVTSVEVLDETFERPAGFDLARYWAESAADFDRSLLRYRCRLRLSPSAARWLGGQVGETAAAAALAGAGEPDADGWRVVDLDAESEVVAASQLVGLGAGVEVLEPEGLRRALHELGAAIAARNAPRPGGRARRAG